MLLCVRDQAIYLGWRQLFHYLDLMDEEPPYWSIIQGFWKAVGSPQTESQAHWKKCAQLAIKALPDGGLALYSKRYFAPPEVQQVEIAFLLFSPLLCEFYEIRCSFQPFYHQSIHKFVFADWKSSRSSNGQCAEARWSESNLDQHECRLTISYEFIARIHNKPRKLIKWRNDTVGLCIAKEITVSRILAI